MTRPITFSLREHNSFADSLFECFTKLESLIGQKHVLGVIFFIDSHSDTDYFRKRKLIHTAFDQNNWPFPFNVQAQSCHSILSVEIWVEEANVTIDYSCIRGTRYTRVTSSMGKSIWGIGITSSEEMESIDNQIEFSFETTRQILEREDMTLSDIVRQWNYIPNILGIRAIGGKSLQNYQVFNEIRQKYYSMDTFHEGYPSATGIGTRNGNFNLDFFATQASSSVQKFGLSNPKQQDAYKYDQAYLVGDTHSGQTKKTPLFERAKLLKTEEETMVFISGTASIIGQETIGIGDVGFQTETTINNMQELIPTNQIQSLQYTYVRAYIKRTDDFEVVRSFCESTFGNVNVSYLQADVCRDNLLVEIEGAAIVGR